MGSLRCSFSPDLLLFSPLVDGPNFSGSKQRSSFFKPAIIKAIEVLFSGLGVIHAESSPIPCLSSPEHLFFVGGGRGLARTPVFSAYFRPPSFLCPASVNPGAGDLSLFDHSKDGAHFNFFWVFGVAGGSYDRRSIRLSFFHALFKFGFVGNGLAALFVSLFMESRCQPSKSGEVFIR